MVVESNPKMQEVFRDGLSKAGYRVLMTTSPSSAVARLSKDSKAADVILFTAQEIGQSALKCFNELSDNGKTHFVRAILLLDEPQRAWEKKASVAAHRKVLSMPDHDEAASRGPGRSGDGENRQLTGPPINHPIFRPYATPLQWWCSKILSD